MAFFLPFLPLLHLPFTWLETFFHEISHGLFAILTGGSIDHITLSRNGEGQCYYEGGLKWLVTFAGYTGASLWGSLIYLGASSSMKTAHEVAIGIVVFVMFSGVMWARDVNTWIILVVIVLMISIPMWFVQKRAIQLFVQFIGIYVLVSSIKAPLELFGISNQGDHLRLEQLTHLPKIMWVSIWVLFSVFLMSLLWYKSWKSNN